MAEQPNSAENDQLPWPADLFQEPSSFRPPSPEPMVIQHSTSDGTSLNIRLVGAHPLWGHVLYPASIILSHYIEEHSKHLFPEGQSTKVVTTDFPDPDLIKNLEWNANENLPDSLRHKLIVKGLKWGAMLEDDTLLKDVHDHSSEAMKLTGSSATKSISPRFDLILLSDLVFNHSEHQSLLTTCENSLSSPATTRPSPSLLVFYSHHRPWCVKADEKFFVIARQRGWECTKIIQDTNAGLAFPQDAGDPSIRGTVHGWKLTRP